MGPNDFGRKISLILVNFNLHIFIMSSTNVWRPMFQTFSISSNGMAWNSRIVQFKERRLGHLTVGNIVFSLCGLSDSCSEQVAPNDYRLGHFLTSFHIWNIFLSFQETYDSLFAKYAGHWRSTLYKRYTDGTSDGTGKKYLKYFQYWRLKWNRIFVWNGWRPTIVRWYMHPFSPISRVP